MRRSMPTRRIYIAALVLMIAVVGCSKNKSTNPPMHTTADVTIEIVANNGSDSFSPNPTTVRVGQTVAWHNAHNMAHTATANAGAFDTGNINSGSTSTPITMSAAGAIAYHCAYHPSMVGTLTVAP